MMVLHRSSCTCDDVDGGSVPAAIAAVGFRDAHQFGHHGRRRGRDRRRPQERGLGEGPHRERTEAGGEGVEGGGDLPLFVYGHSMGGLAVVRLAEKAAAGTVDVPPIAGLVVASAALVAAESIPAPLVAVANVIGKLAPKLPTIRLDGEAISRDPAVRSDYDADPLNYRGKLSAGTGRQMNLAMAAAMDRARTITCPVLVIHGDADRLTAVVGSRRLAATLGSDDVTLREWPGAFHELHHEPERDEVLDTIVSWIGERVGRAD